jgi:hypothetical protein
MHYVYRFVYKKKKKKYKSERLPLWRPPQHFVYVSPGRRQLDASLPTHYISVPVDSCQHSGRISTFEKKQTKKDLSP